MALPEFIMDLIEFLYDYKQLPGLFFLHLVIVGLAGTYLAYLLYHRSQLQSLQTNPKTEPSKCHNYMKYVDYMNDRKRTTESEVQKLQNSKDYQKYLMEKADPNSKYNRQIEVEEIVFSDEQSEMDKARNQRKNKTM